MMDSLKDFALARAGNLVTVQWLGSPKLSVGVLSTATEAEAFERVANAIEAGGTRPGFDPIEMKVCVREMRRRVKKSAQSHMALVSPDPAPIVEPDPAPIVDLTA
jgi:hypothetical protein